MNPKRKYGAIVIGVSAGGLNAVSFILKKLPADFQLPIIIIQHRNTNQRELLEDILQEKCKMKLKQADEKEKIKDGVIYIAPPDYHLLIENDFTFSLSSDSSSASASASASSSSAAAAASSSSSSSSAAAAAAEGNLVTGASDTLPCVRCQQWLLRRLANVGPR